MEVHSDAVSYAIGFSSSNASACHPYLHEVVFAVPPRAVLIVSGGIVGFDCDIKVIRVKRECVHGFRRTVAECEILVNHLIKASKRSQNAVVVACVVLCSFVNRSFLLSGVPLDGPAVVGDYPRSFGILAHPVVGGKAAVISDVIAQYEALVISVTVVERGHRDIGHIVRSIKDYNRAADFSFGCERLDEVVVIFGGRSNLKYFGIVPELSPCPADCFCPQRAVIFKRIVSSVTDRERLLSAEAVLCGDYINQRSAAVGVRNDELIKVVCAGLRVAAAPDSRRNHYACVGVYLAYAFALTLIYLAACGNAAIHIEPLVTFLVRKVITCKRLVVCVHFVNVVYYQQSVGNYTVVCVVLSYRVGEIGVADSAEPNLHAELVGGVEYRFADVLGAVASGIGIACGGYALAVNKRSLGEVSDRILDNYVVLTEVLHALELEVPHIGAVLGSGACIACRGGELIKAASYSRELCLSVVKRRFGNERAAPTGKVYLDFLGGKSVKENISRNSRTDLEGVGSDV